MWVLTAVMAALLVVGTLSYALSSDDPGQRPGKVTSRQEPEPARLEDDDVVVPLDVAAPPDEADEDDEEPKTHGHGKPPKPPKDTKHDTKDSKHD